MRFHILSLFPDMIRRGLADSVIGKATEKKLIELNIVNIRDFSTEKHGKVDDYTYGGGAGMLMQAQPVYDAWKSVCCKEHIRTVYVTPQGRPFTQNMASELAKEKELVILCGHYEGIDERVLEETVTDYVSIGDFVLTGGELAAMVIVDAVSRLVPGVLGNETSADTESFNGDLLEYPQYSRPKVWHEKSVPEVLLTGNHNLISDWRLQQSILRTRERRPDLYARYEQRQRVIQYLSKQKRDYIHIIETLSRGYGEILFEEGKNLLVFDRSSLLIQMLAESEKKAEEMLGMIPCETESFEVTQDFLVPMLVERMKLHVDMECINVLYTNREQLPVRHKDIRKLSMDALPFLLAHYEHGNKEYLEQLLSSGRMYGAYCDDALIGFIGEHEEGSIGLLYVLPEYRRQGFGDSLEAFMINQHRTMGFIPFGQIEVGNKASMSLQEKKGLYLSKGHVWWLSGGNKWQSENA